MAVEHRGKDTGTVGMCVFHCVLKGRREMGYKLEGGLREVLEQGPVVFR